MQNQTIRQTVAAQDEHLPLTGEIMSAALHVAGMSAGAGALGDNLAAVKRALFAAADMARELESRATVEASPEYRLFETCYTVHIPTFLPYAPNWAEGEKASICVRFPVRKSAARWPLVYLAAPYAHTDLKIRDMRAAQATACAAWLMRQGIGVFSPLTHGHPIGITLGPTTYDDWALVDERVLAACDAVLVLDLPGATASEGVRRELELARRMGIPARSIHRYTSDAYLVSSLPAVFGWDGNPGGCHGWA